jgi:hypothetical protein
VRSDFSAIHRIDPDGLERMPAPRAYSLAYRINAYQGLIRGRWLAQEAERTPRAPSGPQEMKSSEWLAQRPRVMDQISKTPIRRAPTRKG